MSRFQPNDLPPPPPLPAKKPGVGGFLKKTSMEAAILSVIFHIVIIAGAGVLTVLVIKGKQPVMFEAKKPPSIPPRKLQHTIRVKQMQQQTRKPQLLQRLVSTAESAVVLPELPKMEMPDMKNMRDTPLLKSAGSEMGAIGQTGSGAGRGLTGGSGYSSTRFFGQDVKTRAIIICMDVSPSMVSKGVVKEVREEAKKMLNRLGPTTKFNIIVFVDGADSFAPQMVFATKENKQKADEYLSKEFDGRREGNRSGFSGSTPSEAIKMGVEMGADTLFVLSDDPPYLAQCYDCPPFEDHIDKIIEFVDDIEKNYGRKVRINNIAYKPKTSERGEQGIRYMKKVSSKTGGKFKKVTRLKYEDLEEDNP